MVQTSAVPRHVAYALEEWDRASLLVQGDLERLRFFIDRRAQHSTAASLMARDLPIHPFSLYFSATSAARPCHTTLISVL